mgnify:FL=1
MQCFCLIVPEGCFLAREHFIGIFWKSYQFFLASQDVQNTVTKQREVPLRVIDGTSKKYRFYEKDGDEVMLFHSHP